MQFDNKSSLAQRLVHIKEIFPNRKRSKAFCRNNSFFIAIVPHAAPNIIIAQSVFYGLCRKRNFIRTIPFYIYPFGENNSIESNHIGHRILFNGRANRLQCVRRDNIVSIQEHNPIPRGNFERSIARRTDPGIGLAANNKRDLFILFFL